MMVTRLSHPEEVESGIRGQPNPNARLEITASTLHAYAHARGRVISQYDPLPDPLHSALYSNRSRSAPQVEVQLPISCMTHIEQLPQGMKFFWDPIVARKIMSFASHRPPPVIPEEVAEDIGYDPSKTPQPESSRSPDRGIGHHLSKGPEPAIPSSMVGDSGYHSSQGSKAPAAWNNFEVVSPELPPSHYWKDRVWANFGYLSYNGSWVDPECERELSAAHRGKMESYHYKATLSAVGYPRRIGPEAIPIHQQDDFYEWYVEEVSDDIDSEGDPRALRIIPEIFAFWAQGAIEGNPYKHKDMKIQSPIPSERYDMEGIIPPPRNMKLQFKKGRLSIVTGISGRYETPQSPTLLYAPLGVDATRVPRNFSAMDPQAAVDIDRAHFLDENTSLASSDNASLAETYTNDGAIYYLSPDDPLLGAREFREAVDRVERKKYQKNWILNRNTDIMKGATAEKWHLDQEVDRMQEMLDAAKSAKEKRTQPKTLKRTSKSSNLSSSCISKDYMDQVQNRSGSLSHTSSEQNLNESTSSGTTPRTQADDMPVNGDPSKAILSERIDGESSPKKRKGQYKRFFRELADNEQMLDVETELAKDVAAGFEDIMMEIEMLRNLKDDLFKALEEAGCNGFAVDAASRSSSGSYVVDSASNVAYYEPTYMEDAREDASNLANYEAPYMEDPQENRFYEDDLYESDGGVSLAW